MSREIRVFAFSLVVWLFSVTGADGRITRRPNNNVIVRGVEAPFYCTSDTKEPTWLVRNFKNPQGGTVIVNEACEWKHVLGYSVKSGLKSCDLYIRYSPTDYTEMFTCRDDTEDASGFLIFLDTLTCEIQDNQFACTLDSSAYENVSAPVDPYLSSLIIWKDDSGNVVGQKYSNFQGRQTTVNAEIPISISKDRPYVCSTEFKMKGFLKSEHSPIVGGPLDEIRCSYPVTASHQLLAQEAAKRATAAAEAAAAAAAKEPVANATGNAAKLERDVIDAIAMLMSLVAAFLVY